MALHRGIQSAIFYYLSCAPCAEIKYRKKRKEEARLDRANRAALEMEQPELYRHPSPSSTNPFWEAERMQGPHGRRKKKTNTNLSAESETRLRMPPPASRDGKTSSNAPRSSNGSPLLSSVDMDTSRPNSRLDKSEPERPRIRFQREDEALWGQDGIDFPPLAKLSTESLRRPPTARSASSNLSHMSGRNAAVNDLHPATTRKITSPHEVAWMLQPPPVAAVMEGKERPSRSRSNSGGSRPSAGSSQPLSRQVSHRIVDAKLRAGQSPEPGMPRADMTPVNGTRMLSTQGHGRKRSLTTGSVQQMSSKDTLSARRGARLPPFQLQSTPDFDSHKANTKSSSFLSPDSARGVHSSLRHTHSAAYPSLSPIISHGSTPRDENVRPLSLRDMRAAWVCESAQLDGSPDQQPESPALSKPPLIRNHSLQSLEKAALDSAFPPTKALAPSPKLSESKIRHPRHQHHHDDLEDSGIDTDLHDDTEVPDSWHSPDFDLHTWVTEHTKRDVRHRWSMDI